jgi:hypothetical protein
VGTIRVSAPDGCAWEVRASRVRLPPWRQIDVWSDTWSTGTDFDLVGILLALIMLPFALLLIPLASAIVEVPIAVGRGLLSSTVWVEAVSHWPREQSYLWRTTRADAPGVRADVAGHLSSGTFPRPARAALVESPSLHG